MAQRGDYPDRTPVAGAPAATGVRTCQAGAMSTAEAPPQLLSTAEMASFVARGFLRLEAVVPDDVNRAATDELEAILATWGSDARPHAPSTLQPLADVYPEPSAVGRMLRTPRVAGALHSLVGADAVFDHDFVHPHVDDPSAENLDEFANLAPLTSRGGFDF